MSFNPFARPTFREAKISLKAVAKIERPEGDNHHLNLNHREIVDALASDQQANVEEAQKVLHEFVRNADGEANRRAINTLIRNGFPANLGPDQYDPYRMVGHVQVGEWRIDLSDPDPSEDSND